MQPNEREREEKNVKKKQKKETRRQYARFANIFPIPRYLFPPGGIRSPLPIHLSISVPRDDVNFQPIRESKTMTTDVENKNEGSRMPLTGQRIRLTLT